jgi:hypothetical protein
MKVKRLSFSHVHPHCLCGPLPACALLFTAPLYALSLRAGQNGLSGTSGEVGQAGKDGTTTVVTMDHGPAKVGNEEQARLRSELGREFASKKQVNQLSESIAPLRETLAQLAGMLNQLSDRTDENNNAVELLTAALCSRTKTMRLVNRAVPICADLFVLTCLLFVRVLPALWPLFWCLGG